MKKGVLITIILLLTMAVGAIAYTRRPPNPGIFTGEHPSKVIVWIGSDGKYYAEIEGFKRYKWGEDTLKECLESAEQGYKWWLEKNTRAYEVIGTYDLNLKH